MSPGASSHHHSRTDLAARAERLRSLHHAGTPLVLANAWDAWSASVVARAGMPAVATSSAAMVASLGYADGGTAPADEVFGAVARVARAVDVPVTADLEDGYGLEAGELVARMLEAGVVGLNLEDSDHHGRPGTLVALRDQRRRVAELRAAARAEGVDVVLNARIDVFLHQGDEPGERVAPAVERAHAYLEAGADCVYPIGFGLPDDVVSRLVSEIGGPVNVLAETNADSVSRLARLGVRRISLGAGLFGVLNERLTALVGELAPLGGGRATP